MDTIRTLQKKYREERAEQANKRRKESSIRKEILHRADIICTTLSGAGSTSLKQDLEGRRIYPHFTCVIVDEACQSNELDLLIPLCFQASKLVLVGDPEQLPCTVLSGRAKEKLFARSMFERLYRFFRYHKAEIEKPVLMLEEQYRMHPEIAAFPSSRVYNNFLRSHRSLEQRQFPLVKHYALFDVVTGRELCQDRGALWNPDEADMIVNFCRDLTDILKPESIGIITPYRKQKVEIQGRLKGLSTGTAVIEVNTVDGFQGREKDVIILSCVRAQQCRGSIGFLTDKQRMNVALTRARHALYVFGHMETLKGGSSDWRALIENAEKRGCFFPVKSSLEVRSILSIGSVKTDHSPAKDPRVKNLNSSSTRVGYHRSNSGDLAVDPNHAPGNVCSTRQESEHNGGTEAPGLRKGMDQMEKSVGASVTKLREVTSINATSASSEASLNSHPTRRIEVVNPESISREEKSGEEGTHSRNRHQQFSRKDCKQLSRPEDHREKHSVGKESKHSTRHSLHRKGSAHQERSGGQSQKTSDDKVTYQLHSTINPLVKNGVSNRDEATSNGPSCKRTQTVSPNIAIEKQSPRHPPEDSVHGKQMKRIESDDMLDATAINFSGKAPTPTSRDPISDLEDNDSDSSLEIDTQNPMLHNVIRNNMTHKKGYFWQLYRQEKEATARSSPVQRTWSPGNTGSPVDQALTALTRVPQPTSSNHSFVSSGPSNTTPLAPTAPILPDNASSSSSRSNASRSSKVIPLRRNSEPPSLKSVLEGNGHPQRPQGSTANASNALSSSSTSRLSNDSSTLSLRPGTARPSNLSNSLGLSRTLSLDEKRKTVRSAEEAAEVVRQRHPPVLGPPIIEATLRDPHGGSRKRSAHTTTLNVSALRGRATREVSPPPKRSAPEPLRRKSLNKTKMNFRGRKSWK